MNSYDRPKLTTVVVTVEESNVQRLRDQLCQTILHENTSEEMKDLLIDLHQKLGRK